MIEHWTIRYLVASTGHWLAGRQVLISPYALQAVNRDAQEIAVALTKQQLADSPSLDTDKPVSRQFEEEYYGFYGWPRYGVGRTCGGSIRASFATANNGAMPCRVSTPGIRTRAVPGCGGLSRAGDRRRDWPC